MHTRARAGTHTRTHNANTPRTARAQAFTRARERLVITHIRVLDMPVVTVGHDGAPRVKPEPMDH